LVTEQKSPLHLFFLNMNFPAPTSQTFAHISVFCTSRQRSADCCACFTSQDLLKRVKKSTATRNDLVCRMLGSGMSFVGESVRWDLCCGDHWVIGAGIGGTELLNHRICHQTNQKGPWCCVLWFFSASQIVTTEPSLCAEASVYLYCM
jgi:hypothetical protein